MAKMFSAEIKGDKQLVKELSKLNKKMPGAIDFALKKEAYLLEADAVPITPHARIEGGNLKNSTEIKQIPTGYSVGFYAPYAIYVHEMTGPVNWSKPGTGPKFLQKPFEKRLKGLTERLKKSVLKRLGL
mgnify:CR=1 FL=1